MPDIVTSQRPLRADARRNQERLLAEAREAFNRDGPDACLEDIARRAGVGIGTLYRHFPTRQDLQEAVFLGQAEELGHRADELANDPDPLEGLISWLRLQVDFGCFGRKLGTAVMTAKHREGAPIQQACSQARDRGAVMLRRAQDAGQVRGDVDLGDLLRLLHGMVLATAETPDTSEQVDRMFALVVAGLRA